MNDNLIKRLREHSNARKGELAELTREAADALERQKGEWIPLFMADNRPYCCDCSVCGSTTGSMTNYCANCGAKMRQGGGT